MKLVTKISARPKEMSETEWRAKLELIKEFATMFCDADTLTYVNFIDEKTLDFITIIIGSETKSLAVIECLYDDLHKGFLDYNPSKVKYDQQTTIIKRPLHLSEEEWKMRLMVIKSLNLKKLHGCVEGVFYMLHVNLDTEKIVYTCLKRQDALIETLRDIKKYLDTLKKIIEN